MPDSSATALSDKEGYLDVSGVMYRCLALGVNERGEETGFMLIHLSK
jgi:hypothetical protein